MRRFVCVSHTGDPSGAWSLNDLAGAAGRVDVLCRNVQAALFLSHGLRDDVEVHLVFAREPGRERTVRIHGGQVQMLHPDERSTGARIQQALATAWAVPDWKEVQRGIAVAAFGLAGLLEDLAGKGTLVLLDPHGTPVEDVRDWPDDPVFLLSDHQPFTPQEYALLADAGARRVSLGPHWYHGNHAIAVVQHALDRHLERMGRPVQAPGGKPA